MRFPKLTLENIIRWAIPLYIFLLPWQARYIFEKFSTGFQYYGDLSFYLTDGLFLLILILWGVWMWRVGAQNFVPLRKMSTPHKIMVAIIAFIIIYSGLSVLWSLSHVVAFWKWIRLLQALLLLIIILTFPIRARAIFLAIMGAGVLQGMWALQQFVLQDISANTWLGIAGQNPGNLGVSVVEFNQGRWLRAYGSFPHPNILGAFLALGGIIASAWYISVYLSFAPFVKKWKKMTLEQLRPYKIQIAASYSGFAIIILGLLLSFSRTAWLGFAVGWSALVIVLLVLTKKKKRMLVAVASLKLVIAGLLILLALTMLNGPMWTQRAADASRLAIVSTTERSQLFDQAQSIVAVSPIFGQGIGGYLPKMIYLWPDHEIYFYQPVHNTWMLLWAELGSIGLAVFGLWLAIIFYWIKELFVKRKGKLDLDKELISAVLISIGVMAYFEHFWWTLPIGIIVVSIWLSLYIKKSK